VHASWRPVRFVGGVGNDQRPRPTTFRPCPKRPVPNCGSGNSCRRAGAATPCGPHAWRTDAAAGPAPRGTGDAPPAGGRL